MKKTTMPGMPEVEVVEIKTSAPVNVLADPAPAKKPAAKRTRKTAAAKTTAAKTEAKKPAAKRGRKPKAATAAAKKAEGPKKPTALIIMDGFGHREETKGNAIEAAKKPNLDKIFAENPRKEGGIRPAATWQEIKRPDSRTIIFLDNNVLAHEHGLQQIEEMGHADVKVDFNQGLDTRLITPEIAAMLAKLHWVKYVRLSCDTSDMLPVIAQAVAYLREAGIGTHRLWSYMLVQDVEEAYHRALVLKALGIQPFAQPYRDYDGGCEPTAEQKRFARWVNRKEIFYTCGWHEYRRRK